MRRSDYIFKEGTVHNIEKALNKSMVVDLVFSNKPIHNPYQEEEFIDIKLDYDMGWIVGLYLAEGCRHGKRGIVFTLNSKEKHFFERIKKRIDNLGLYYDGHINTKLKVNWWEKGSRGTVSVTSQKILDFLDRYIIFGSCYTKRLKEFTIYNTPIDFRKGILDGMLDGDGTTHKSGYYILRLANEGMIKDFENLSNSLGIKARNYGNSKELSGAYHYTMTCYLPKRQFKETDFDGELTSIKALEKSIPSQMYDLSVEDGLFIANNLITHNSNAEICLLGTKGKTLERKSKSVRQVCDARIGRHSEKPPEIRDRIVELWGDISRIELFARERVEGWDAIGFEVDGEDIRRSLCCV